MDLGCEDPGLFDFASDADIWEKADSLTVAYATATRPEFLKLQKTAVYPNLCMETRDWNTCPPPRCHPTFSSGGIEARVGEEELAVGPSIG